MSTVKTTYDDRALAGEPIARDEARGLLGQVMGLVAVAVAFAALGAYLGRDLSGATGLVLFIGAFACIFGLNIAAARGREQLAIGDLRRVHDLRLQPPAPREPRRCRRHRRQHLPRHLQRVPTLARAVRRPARHQAGCARRAS
jgi:hypothetical protein